MSPRTPSRAPSSRKICASARMSLLSAGRRGCACPDRFALNQVASWSAFRLFGPITGVRASAARAPASTENRLAATTARMQCERTMTAIASPASSVLALKVIGRATRSGNEREELGLVLEWPRPRGRDGGCVVDRATRRPTRRARIPRDHSGRCTSSGRARCPIRARTREICTYGAPPNGCTPPQPSSTQPPGPLGLATTSRAMSQPCQYGPCVAPGAPPKACSPPHASMV